VRALAISVLCAFGQGIFPGKPQSTPEQRVRAMVDAKVHERLLQWVHYILENDNTWYESMTGGVMAALRYMIFLPGVPDWLIEAGGLKTVVLLVNRTHDLTTKENSVGLLNSIANDEKKLDIVADCGAFEIFIDECRSTEQSLNRRALVALKNFTHHVRFAERLARLNAHLWLTPNLYSSSALIGWLACRVIINISRVSDQVYDQVEQSGAIEECLRFMRRYNPRYFSDAVVKWRPTVVDDTCKMAAQGQRDPIRLCGALSLLHISSNMDKAPDNRLIFENPEVWKIVDSLCRSPDVWLYRIAAEIVANVGRNMPHYQQNFDAMEFLKRPATEWTEEQVCHWVGLQRFSHHEPLFRVAWIDGDLLLGITNEDLVEMGVTNPMHRKRILRSVSELAAVTEKPVPSASSSSLSLAAPHVFGHAGEESYDVFLSYRRSNGSQLAQLLKVCLKQKNFTVFLDVDELGQGEFDKGLLRKLRASKSVVLLLTKGALDRCTIVNDPENKDWVRKEIATSLAEQKKIIPIAHDFTFPARDELPDDIKDIVVHNSIPWSHEYMDATVDKVISFFRKGK